MNNNIFETDENEDKILNFPSKIDEAMSIHTDSNNSNSINRNEINYYLKFFFQNTKHPYICFIHILFKFLSVFFYFIGPLIFRNEKSKENDFIVTFAITFFLVSLDFYLVKNITGRFLVKMIWWIDVNDDYSNKIVFHSLEENLLNKLDKNIFWYSLYVNFFIWLIQTIQMLISLQVCWFLLCFLCLFLSFYNLFNFWKCSKEQHKVVGNVLNQINLNSLFKKVFNN
ncbi:golgi apparatus membrane protein TVP23, putative [Plasmodium relictum]|uniref:Golgi apparatus membrane protein TVP23 homolog n=1 Tax=Plasmodium relictum TaxID=85471 RepID=A0A1J1H9Z9_PLARL|nr:golgi apparatus membrane protein TVP23, putative [Plasmodium relictum]CRH01336.1 golgi apparatus membrane protein TVP23, putative [Plasmodium relictum]